MTFAITATSTQVAASSTSTSEPATRGGHSQQMRVDPARKVTASGAGFKLTSR